MQYTGGKIMSLENKFDEIKGSVKEGLGKLTGDNHQKVKDQQNKQFLK